MSEWKKVWLSNYNGNSEAAKELEPFVKKNYKGHSYLPWATMVKWLYLLDDEAVLDVIRTEKGDFVHTSRGELVSSETTRNDKIVDEKTISNEKEEFTRNTFASNSVVLRCVFLGREFVEVYPVQDNSYNSPEYYDSNMVNKSIQRAKAKVISTATGLAFTLYENGDLQFEDDKPDKSKTNLVKEKQVVVKDSQTPTINKIEDKIVSKTYDTTNQEVLEDVNPDVASIFTLIKSNPVDILPILQKVNVDLIKNFNFSLSPEDSDEDLTSKLNSLKNPAIFNRMLHKRFEDSKGDK